jgi:serine protease
MRLRNGIALGFSLLTILASGASAHGADRTGDAGGFAPRQVIVKFAGEASGRARALPAGIGVRKATEALRANPAVSYAAPNYIATASAFNQQTGAEASNVPNDPGTLPGQSAVPGAWVTKQWGFLPWEGPGTALLPVSPGGINAVGGWEHLAAAKRPGAKGVTVAVLDTGIAYRPLGSRFRRSPDFSAGQFVKGFDFVAGNPLPLDRNGHGTHVAGTIAEKTNNGIGLTGLAYRAKLMPVRVLDRFGSGRADDIAAGVRFAADNGADVINMSFNFGCGKRVPSVTEAIRYASRKGVVAVASVGNLGSESCVSPPATIDGVIGVGGTTEGGCLGSYSLAGKGVDVVAPGGGTAVAGCPSVLTDPIYQVTFKGSNERRFGEPGFYVGTSMAAAHASGVAAMILAAGVVDRRRKAPPIPVQVTLRIKKTARSIGLSPLLEGAGLIDAARATDPACQAACLSGDRRRPR